MDDDNNPKEEDLIACPECGGSMAEDDGDTSMIKCVKCDYRMTADEANESTVGGEE